MGAKWHRAMTRLLTRCCVSTPEGFVSQALAAPELRRAQWGPTWSQVTLAGATVGAKLMPVGAKWIPVGGKWPQGDDEVVNALLCQHAKRPCFTSPGGT